MVTLQKYLVVLSLVFGQSVCVKVKILSPKTGTGDSVNVAVIIVPGASITGEAYQPLGLKIQDAFPGSLWVALLTDFLMTTPNPLELPRGVQLARDELQKSGFHGNKVFLAGHSLGGVFVADYGLKQEPPLTGVMLFASYLTRGHRLRDYPTPLLTISGDLDGLTRITRIVETFEELENEMKHSNQSIDMFYKTPVIVMGGINHGHFASGDMPPNVKMHDIPVDDDVTFDSAHKTIARHVTNFIASTIGQPLEYYPTALSELKAAFQDTKSLMQPLSLVKAMDQNVNQSSATTVMSQKFVIGLDLSSHVKVRDREIPAYDVTFYEPDVSAVKNDMVNVTTFSNVRLPFNPEDVSLGPQTPLEIQSMMKSQEYIQDLLPNVPATNHTYSCKYLNMIIFDIAMDISSSDARERWTKRGARNITFHDDIISGSKLQWEASHLRLDYETADVSLEVTSNMLAYGVSDTPEKNSGALCCKLLSPYRAMEWIYIDSLK